METANPQQRRGPGRPFRPGYDPRRNPGGRPRDPLTADLRAQLTDEEIATLNRTLIAYAKAGNLKAIALIYDRLEGKAVARQEAGDPGEFTRPDFSDLTTDELREYIRVLRGQRDEPAAPDGGEDSPWSSRR